MMGVLKSKTSTNHVRTIRNYHHPRRHQHPSPKRPFRRPARLAEVAASHRKSSPKFADWLEANIPEGLTIFLLPEPFRRRLRTTNMAESLNLRIKRRTRVAGLFPNEPSALRLVTSILMKTSEE